MSAAWSMSPPRLVLTRKAVGFMKASVCSLMMCLVEVVIGAWMETKSAS